MLLTTQKLVFLILSLSSLAAEETSSVNPCESTEFRCKSGRCIPMRWRCDGDTECNDGSDEEQCVELLDSAIFVSEESSVFYIRPESTDRDNLTILPLPFDNINITRVAFDSNSQYLFAADIRQPSIFAINLTSNETHVLAKNVERPADLAFDWSSNNLYWIDSSKRTAEVISVYQRRDIVLLTGLQTPIALAILPSRGHMFIATEGVEQAILMYDMDGRIKGVLPFPGNTPTALHVSLKTLFWADYQKGAIYHASYSDLSQGKVLKTGIEGVMSVAADEKYIYYTAERRGLHMFNGVITHVLKLPGQDANSRYRRISYIPSRDKTGRQKCLQDNGGCSYLCLTAPRGTTCACPSDMLLDKDNLTCVSKVKGCDENEFRCLNGRCLPLNQRCDGVKNCEDGSDESDELDCSDPCGKRNCSQACENSLSGPRCTCKYGFKLDLSDKKTCIDIDECQQDGFCSQRCLNARGSYECSCEVGYELVNRACKAEGPDPLLYFSTNREIGVVDLNSKSANISTLANGWTTTFDYHPKNLQIYWVEVESRYGAIIYSKNGNRTSRTILRHGKLYLEDIAIDYIANNLYVTDMKFREVLVCRLDGSMCHTLHDTEVGEPHSISLDLDSRLMYWSDWDEKFVGIYRSGMDGSGRISLVSEYISKPYGITLDRSAQRLYWVDVNLRTIEFITFDRSLRKVILESKEYEPYAVAVFEDNIYWFDKSTLLVNSCNKFSGQNVTTVMQNDYLEIKKLRVYHPSLLSKASNPCDNVCSHMCLISPHSHSGYVCICPRGFKMSKDGRTCSNESSCKPGEVWCSPGKLCIAEKYICDRKNDCLDGSDEKRCDISSIITREDGTELMFMAEGPNIYVGVPNATGYQFKHQTPLETDAMITSLSYDSKSQTLFISEANRPAVYALSTITSGVRELVVNQLTSPKDIDFDFLSNNLYWVDSIKGTVEVTSVHNQKRIVLLENLATPVSIALLPHRDNMFVSTIGDENHLTVYRMDGKGKRIIHSVQGVPMSLVLHPSKTILYWADSRAGMIMYVNYTGSSSPWILKSGINGVMSVAASEDNVYWTVQEMISPVVDENIFINKLSDQTDQTAWRSIVLSEKNPFSGKSECLNENNGGCSYLCLTSHTGRTCSCSSAMKLARDGQTCLGKRCERGDFSCSDGQCIPSERKCDGSVDCSDGSDELNCTKLNSRVRPFQYESKKLT